MFYFGNNHATNFSMMLQHLQGKDLQNEGYENLVDKLSYSSKTVSFRDHYSHKVENYKTADDDNEEFEKLQHPNFYNFRSTSLN